MKRMFSRVQPWLKMYHCSKDSLIPALITALYFVSTQIIKSQGHLSIKQTYNSHLYKNREFWETYSVCVTVIPLSQRGLQATKWPPVSDYWKATYCSKWNRWANNPRSHPCEITEKPFRSQSLCKLQQWVLKHMQEPHLNAFSLHLRHDNLVHF